MLMISLQVFLPLDGLPGKAKDALCLPLRPVGLPWVFFNLGAAGGVV